MKPRLLCNVIHAWLVGKYLTDMGGQISAEAWEQWEEAMAAPLPGETPDDVDEAVVESEMDAFARFKAML
jgi:hypothetical protein